MSGENTALARTEEQDLPEQGRQEVRAIQQMGAVAVAKQRAINATTKQLAGMKWGDVSGDKLSTETRYAIAQLCDLTGANPGQHLYILGNRAYLNADYWGQVVAQERTSLGFEQFNISASATEDMRKEARQLVKDAQEFDMPELRDDALKMFREAARLDGRRIHFGIKPEAVAAYETVIRRYAEHAPLAAIAAGRVDPTPFIIEVHEANWAGGKKNDPVGDARPAETARSRSLRRCAVKAFATTLAAKEAEIRKLEDAIEAEFTVIASDRREARQALPTPDGPQAVRIGAGEPEAARPTEEAQPLPVVEAGLVPADPAQPARLAPPSGHAKAEKKKFEQGCNAFGIDDVNGFMRDHLGHPPVSLEDYQALNLALAKLADGGEEQGGLGV